MDYSWLIIIAGAILFSEYLRWLIKRWKSLYKELEQITIEINKVEALNNTLNQHFGRLVIAKKIENTKKKYPIIFFIAKMAERFNLLKE